jgi:hypothetical protein
MKLLGRPTDRPAGQRKEKKYMRRSRAGAMLIALGLGCSGCFIECEDITLSQGQSADGVYGARASYIDCGVLSGFSLNIEITEKSLFGYTNQRHVLGVLGRFTARFDWPESRRLRVTVTCEVPGFCTGDQVEILRKELESSARAWGNLKIDYAFE